MGATRMLHMDWLTAGSNVLAVAVWATSKSRMQARLLSATVATRVFTKTPLEWVSLTMARMVAGAVAIATAARRAAICQLVLGRKTTAKKTRAGVTLASSATM